MLRALQLLLKGLRALLGSLGYFVLWSFWMLLALGLAAQVWILWKHELAIPSPLLRLLERRLERPEYQVKLGKVSLDTEGYVIIQDFALLLTDFGEPILRGRLAHTRISLAGALAGNPELGEINLSGVELLLPSQLSPSGKSEAWAENLDAVVKLRRREILIDDLSASNGPLSLFVQGGIDRSLFRKAPDTSSPNAWLGKLVLALRKLALYSPQLKALEGARLYVTLTPSETSGAIADLRLSLDKLSLPQYQGLEAGPLLLSGSVPLASREPFEFVADLTLQKLQFTKGRAEALRLRARARLTPSPFKIEPLSADLTARQVESYGVRVETPCVHVEPGPLPNLKAEVSALVAGTPLGLQVFADPYTRTGKAALQARVSPEAVDLVASFAKKDFRRFVTLETPGYARLTASFAKGKLGFAEAWVEANHFTSHFVPIEHVQGHVSWDGKRFSATDAFVITGKSLARGSYEMEVPSKDYRMLLTGRLIPADINGWFKEWWPNFWQQFDFSHGPPEADMDIQGRWLANHHFNLFGIAEARKPRIREVEAERVLTRMFVRSAYFHAVSLDLWRKEGEAHGWFSRVHDAPTSSWRAIDFDMTGSLNLAECAVLLGPQGTEMLQPYVIAVPPKIRAYGHLDGPVLGPDPKHKVEVTYEGTGPFKLQGFPLEDVSFQGRYLGKRIELDWVKARLAQGKVDAKILISPEGAERKMKIEGSLKDAQLGEIIKTVEDYTASKQIKPAAGKASSSELMSDARIDLTLDAQGKFGDPYGLYGSGTAQLTAAELGHVRLLGTLSHLLSFSSLRFTSAKSSFNLEGEKITFPDLRVSGRNSTIDANGSYSMRNKTLDVNAKVWPFRESQGLIRGTFGLVLSPLSYMLEVRLQGSLSDPSWSFLHNPFRFLSSTESMEATPNAASDAFSSSSEAPVPTLPTKSLPPEANTLPTNPSPPLK